MYSHGAVLLVGCGHGKDDVCTRHALQNFVLTALALTASRFNPAIFNIIHKRHNGGPVFIFERG